MSSDLWTAFRESLLKNPVSQSQLGTFCIEADSLLTCIIDGYASQHFARDDRSVEKAVWMLHLDAMNTLKTCVVLLRQGAPWVIRKLCRDVMECVDRSTLFREKGHGDRDLLDMWYDCKVVPHCKFRDHLADRLKRPRKQCEAKKSRTNLYSYLSAWTHHCYDAVGELFLEDDNSTMAYDGNADELLLSQAGWMLAQLTRFLCSEVECAAIIPQDDLIRCKAQAGWC